jgi:predicted enzyme related to lactoylglutathione lyase
MGNPFVHIELNTTDLSKAKKFYKAIFDWKLEDMPMGPGMTYTMLDVGKGTGGGMLKKPMPDAPTQWLPYVEVDSVEKTIAKAKKAGAQIYVDYMEIGEGMGAFGIFGDPTGAALGVWETTKKRQARQSAAKKNGAKKKPAKKR